MDRCHLDHTPSLPITPMHIPAHHQIQRVLVSGGSAKGQSSLGRVIPHGAVSDHRQSAVVP